MTRNSHSIRSRLTKLALSIVLMFTFVLVVFSGLHTLVINKYKSVSDNIISEYQLNAATADLITAYNRKYHSHEDDKTATKNIKTIEIKINDLLKNIESRIVNHESKINFIGLKNTIENVVNDVNEGIKYAESGDVVKSVEYFNSANEKYFFVSENSTRLIFSELKYSEQLQDEINILYLQSIIFFICFIFLILIISILYLSSFSQKIIVPIEKLTTTVSKVISGDLEIPVDKKLLAQKDEVGVLANSFVVMVTKIKEKINELNEFNAKIQVSKDALEKSNGELNKLNEFMVGREIKMTELKKKIEELEKNQIK